MIVVPAIVLGLIGATIGMLVGELGLSLMVVGAAIGAAMGWVARLTVRQEVARTSEQLWREWREALLDEIRMARGAPVPGLAPAAAHRYSPPPAEQEPVSAPPAPASPPPPFAPIEPPFRMPAERAPARVIRTQSERVEPGFGASGGIGAREMPPIAFEPSPAERAVAAARAWLLGGNTVARVGLLLLFVGLSFLARYAASAGLFPIELRLALVALTGIALLGIGFRTRVARPDFGLGLQGGGVGVIYLTIFAAARFYDLLPVGAAFVLMAVVCVLACALALMQDSAVLAGAAFAGGFATPLLLGGEGGDPLLLFGYGTLLNCGVLFIAARRSWRWLNLLGFFATFGIATLWGWGAYGVEHYWPAQVFLILSVLIYVGAGVLYSGSARGRSGPVVDATLLFGPALAGFGLQAALVHDTRFASAFSALGFAALYLATAVAIGRRRAELGVLRDGAIAVASGFVALAAPLALGARWTSSVWALEGAGAFWLGMRQARWSQRAFGLGLQGLGALLFVSSIGASGSGGVLHPDCVGAMLVAAPLFATAWWLRRPETKGATGWAGQYLALEQAIAPGLFLVAFGFWALGWAVEVRHLIEGAGPTPSAAVRSLSVTAVMLALVASAALAATLGRRVCWAAATWPARATLAALGVGFFAELGTGGHVLQWPGAMLWAAAIAFHLWLLRREDEAAPAPAPGWLTMLHVGGVWLAAAIVADTLWLGVDRGRLWNTSWAGVAFLVSAIAMLAVLTWWAGRPRARWPLDRHRSAYLWTAALPIALLVFAGALVTAIGAAGETAPLPYVPLLNPVDLSVALALAVLFHWRRRVLADDLLPAAGGGGLGTPFLVALAGLAFAAVNSVWLRTAHHSLGVAWRTEPLMDDVVVQAGLAIIWTVLALALMVAAYRRGMRALWLVGAALLALTVAKLLLVDLTAVGGAARIVAFIVVGVLMLVVGYVAPLPPRRAETGEGA